MTAIIDSTSGTTASDGALERFGGLVIERSDEVLAPRPWTAAQSRWAARRASRLDEGPALELYAGGGQIGLEFVRLTGRPLVQVEASAAACRLARRNADRNGLGHLVTIRHTRVGSPLGPFALVLADPPYVPSSETTQFPDDPLLAIDGGDDGTAQIRDLVRALPRYLAPTTPVLIQVHGPAQARQLPQLLSDGEVPLRVDEIRAHGPHRAVVLLETR
jgi:release factor glutamine methyltransferase